jgi:putative membrane protein
MLMTLLSRALVLLVVIFHALIFVVESFFWMQPAVYQVALKRLSPLSSSSAHDQALVLKSVFINLGFYNLFLAIAGAAGVIVLALGHSTIGRTLIGYMCLSAVAAGLVLLFSTQAYIGALLQAAPAAAALALMARYQHVGA